MTDEATPDAPEAEVVEVEAMPEICEDGPAKIVPMKPAVTDEGFEFLAGMQGKGWLVAHKHTHDAKDSDVMVVFLSRKK